MFRHFDVVLFCFCGWLAVQCYGACSLWQACKQFEDNWTAECTLSVAPCQLQVQYIAALCTVLCCAVANHTLRTLADLYCMYCRPMLCQLQVQYIAALCTVLCCAVANHMLRTLADFYCMYCRPMLSWARRLSRSSPTCRRRIRLPPRFFCHSDVAVLLCV